MKIHAEVPNYNFREETGFCIAVVGLFDYGTWSIGFILF